LLAYSLGWQRSQNCVDVQPEYFIAAPKLAAEIHVTISLVTGNVCDVNPSCGQERGFRVLKILTVRVH
jgi:hypothetical protein